MLSIAVVTISSIVIQLWGTGYTHYSMNLSRNKNTAFKNFYYGFQHFGKVLGVLLLQFFYIWLYTFLVVMIGILPLLRAPIVLYILALVAASFAYYTNYVAIYVLYDNPTMPLLEVMRHTRKLTKHHRLELFLLDLHFFWYYLLVLAISMPVALFSSGIMPSGLLVGIIVYCITVGISLLLDAHALPYIHTTKANAYNWLVDIQKKGENPPEEPYIPIA